MITVKVDHKKETVTYSTLIEIDGNLISLRVLRYLGYQKPYQLNHTLPLPEELTEKKISLFEDLFYWPKEYYTSPKRNHLAYANIKYSDYYFQSLKPYEIQWEIIKISFELDNRKALRLENKKDWHLCAIPPNGSEEKRFDCITDDNSYHYNCGEKEFAGILITLEPLEGKISACYSGD